MQIARFGLPAANLVDAIANLPLSTHKVPSQHSRGTITVHSYRECSMQIYSGVINGWAMALPPHQPCVGDNGDALHLQIVYNKKKMFSPKTKKDLGMACHTPPLKKKKRNKGKCHYPASVPSH